LPPLPVIGAEGVRLRLADGRELVDGMSSWWSAIHGYRHPALDDALRQQLGCMAHVMFGGLTHEPALRLAQLLDRQPERRVGWKRRWHRPEVRRRKALRPCAYNVARKRYSVAGKYKCPRAA